MTCVLSLDPATTTGYALWRPGLEKPRASTVVMPDVERDMGWWGEAFLEWLVPFSRLEGVTEIVVEAPIIVIHKNENTEHLSVNTIEIEKLVSLSAFAALGARQLGVPFTRAKRGDVCQHFIGVRPGKNYRRSYIKPAVISCCQRKGWNTQDEDIADALATLDWYVHDRRIQVPWNCQPAPGPLFEQQGVRIETTHKVASTRLIRSALSFDREKAGLA